MLASAVLLAPAGCSEDCSHEPVERAITSLEYQAYLAGARSSCEWRKFVAGLAPAESKCPGGEAARAYLMACSGELNPNQGDRVDGRCSFATRPRRTSACTRRAALGA